MLKKHTSLSFTMKLVCLSVLLCCLYSCSFPSFPSINPQPPKNTHPVKGGTWIDELYSEPDSLIPNGAVKRAAAIIDQAIYAPLFYGDAHGAIHAGLARDIPTIANGDISSDLQTWTFHLKPNLLWSDGVPLDANDVNFTWKLWTNPHFGAANTYGLNLITSATVSADNLSIIFHLKRPFAPFVSLWTDGLFAPLPAHHFKTIAPAKVLLSADNLNPSVTSGPFLMSESIPGDHYTVFRNPNYYRAAEGLPYIDKIVFRVVPDQNKALKDFQSGKLDSGWFTDVTNPSAYQHLPNYTLVENVKSTNFEALYFNFHNAILAHNPEVRQAIAMAIDTSTLIKTARLGQAVPLCTDHSAALQPGYQSDASCPNFDANAANALLDQHGWHKGTTGYRSKGNQKLEFQYSASTNNAAAIADEALIQQNLQAIGIKLDIQNYPSLTFYGTLLLQGKSGTYDIVEFENALNYDADDSYLFSCNQMPPNGFNIAFYCNKNLNSLYTQELSTADAATRQHVFKQIHTLYLTEFPFIVLYAPLDLALAKKGVHNYLPAPQGALETINVWEWWCDGGHCPA